MVEDAWQPRALADDDADGHTTHGADSGVHRNSKTDDLKDDRASALPREGDPQESAARLQEAPDVLRWRAEMLLDEMMIGAVDSSAGAGPGPREVAPPGGARAPSGTLAHEGTQSHAASEQTPANGHGGNGGGFDEFTDVDFAYGGPEEFSAPNESEAATQPERSPRAALHIETASPYSQSPSAATPHDSDAPSNGATSAAHTADDPSLRQAYMPAAASSVRAAQVAHEAEQDPRIYEAASDASDGWRSEPAGGAGGGYRPSAYSATGSRATPDSASAADSGRTNSQSTPSFSAERQPAWAAPSADSGYAALEQEPHPYDDEAQRRLTAVESRYPRAVRRVPAPQPYTNGSGGAHNDQSFDESEAASPGLGPVRRNPAVVNGTSVSASLVGAMAVGGRNSKYAALLPRSTPWDTHEMEREIASLSDEMTRVLPAGHESSRRARHLLEKAQTIFSTDPLRSAEVDYYLSQVRAIVQRSRQTHEWSMLYRKRLTTYLNAWIVFSAVCLVGAVLFAPEFAATGATLFGWPEDGFWGQGFLALFLALFGGSLGGALGARLNLRRYQRLEIGYVDRKYGLRTLILPLMGMLVGLVCFVVLGGFLWFLGYSMAGSPGIQVVPAALAFLISFLQETIYGTRD